MEGKKLKRNACAGVHIYHIIYSFNRVSCVVLTWLPIHNEQPGISVRAPTLP